MSGGILVESLPIYRPVYTDVLIVLVNFFSFQNEQYL